MASPPPAYFDEDDGAPPPYSECVEQQPPLQVRLTIIDELLVDNAAAVAAIQETVTLYNYAPEVTLNDYLEHPLSVINSNLNMTNSIKGLINILYDQQKLPWKFKLQVAYKVNLLIYYFINFVYQMVACAVQGDNIGYYVTFIIILFFGLIFETFELTSDLYPHVKRWYISHRQIANVSHPSSEPQVTEIDADIQIPHKQKAKNVLKKYILHSIGELLIFPCLICSLYGYVNEKSWQFNNAIAGFNFILFVYTIVIDALCIKFYLIWLLQRVIRVSYEKYDELKDELLDEKTTLGRYISPLYMTIPFAVLLTLLHWSMLAITGVRIYVDNFSNVTNNSPGSYKSSSFTRYMIFCCAYLPITSWIAYIILNKYWFYEVYTIIKQFTDQEISMQSISPWVKLITFVFDPAAYISVILLILPFIAFTIGTFLPDYNNSKYEVSIGASTGAESLGILFIILFLLSNLQATTAFGILVVTVVVAMAVVGLLIAVILVVAAVIIIVGTLTGAFVVLGLMCFAVTMCYND